MAQVNVIYGAFPGENINPQHEQELDQWRPGRPLPSFVPANTPVDPDIASSSDTSNSVKNPETETNKKLSRQETPNSGGGAKGDETSGGDDDDDDTQMRAQRSRHMRAHESRHMRAHI